MIKRIALVLCLLGSVTLQTVRVLITDPTRNIWLSESQEVTFQADSASTPNYYTINVDDTIKYQTMDGFGASLTEASCWLFKNKLTDAKRNDLLRKLFSTDGIHLSILRQPIGASDFNWNAWTYDDSETDDWNLTSFSLAREDAYIRPILNQAIGISPGRIKLFSSPWSPPAWLY